MLLHVANGHSTTRLIERSGLPGRTAIWADPLNEGPVPGNISEDELLLGSSIAPGSWQAPRPR